MRLAVPPEIDPAAMATWRSGVPVMELAGETMGTSWRVKLAVPERFDGLAVRAAIVARLDDIVAQMSHWEPDSLLGQFNRAAPDTWFDLPTDFATVIATGLDIAQRSQGAFDPAIGALVNLWGHGPVAVEGPPDEAALEAARAVSGWQRLKFADGRLRQPGGLQLDLSGIAKGYAVDAVADLLATHGIAHCLVEIGGELVGRGMRPDGNPWWVELETPADTVPPIRVALHQSAVATSGDYVRGFHTIDPRTGSPVKHAMAVSVIHTSAMLADGWATALSVLPPAAMREMAQSEDLKVRALMRVGNGVEEWLSPSLRTMIKD